MAMIPLVDDYIQLFIAEKLSWLKQHPVVINHIFRTGKRETLEKLQDFITNRKIKVIIGYPKEQSSLPAYVITLAPESEQPIGLGDDNGYYEGYGIGADEEDYIQKAEEKISEFISGTYMNSNYRIECWSDNGDLTAYMYIILKWCIWSSRQQMLDMGWVNIKMSGTDLEPVPDYFPIFIYRRAAQLSLMYENLYYENVKGLDKYIDVITHPEDYHGDEDGNVKDKDENIVIPGKYNWILRAHYYQVETGVETFVKEYRSQSLEKGEDDDELKTAVVDELPEIGRPNVIYFVKRKNSQDQPNSYLQYYWIDGKFEPFGRTAEDVDLSKYATVSVVDEKDKVVLEKSQNYTDEKEFTAEDVGLEEIGSTGINDLFSQIFRD